MGAHGAKMGQGGGERVATGGGQFVEAARQPVGPELAHDIELSVAQGRDAETDPPARMVGVFNS